MTDSMNLNILYRPILWIMT